MKKTDTVNSAAANEVEGLFQKTLDERHLKPELLMELMKKEVLGEELQSLLDANKLNSEEIIAKLESL